MAMMDAQRQEAAEALFHAELTREWMEPTTLTYDGADIDNAYAIGQYVTDLQVSAGRVVKGHKAGLTSKTMRSVTGATEPEVSMSILNRRLVEIERRRQCHRLGQQVTNLRDRGPCGSPHFG